MSFFFFRAARIAQRVRNRNEEQKNAEFGSQVASINAQRNSLALMGSINSHNIFFERAKK
jgi:hypothetical protein